MATFYFGLVTELSNNTFNQCQGLVSVNLDVQAPNCLKINNGAFNDCLGIKSLVANNVTEVGSGAFRNGAGGSDVLKYIEMQSVQTLDDFAFSGRNVQYGTAIFNSAVQNSPAVLELISRNWTVTFV